MNKDFEPGSILSQRDYTKHNDIGLIASILICTAVIVVGFVVPLLG